MHKKIIAVVVVVVLLLCPALGLAAVDVPGYEGGIRDEYQYREVLFLTGEPIELTGSVDVKPGRSRGGAEEIRYTYRLDNVEHNVRLSRTVTMTNTTTTKGSQTITQGELTRYSESLRIGGDRFDLEDYTMYRSVVTDHQPAVDYYSGNWTVRKVYLINRNEGKTIIETTGELVGYNQHWGATETQQMSIRIRTERDGEGDQGKRYWNGTAQITTSYNRTRDMNYVHNQPSQISFDGGYLLTEQEENVLHYTYDLPMITEAGEAINHVRNTGRNVISLIKVPHQTRLALPQVKDVRGHWAEPQITQLYSLGVFDPQENYFGVRLPMTRSQFARAVALALDLQPEGNNTPAVQILGGSNQSTVVRQSFNDVSADHPDRLYVELIEEKGIMKGVGGGLFAPDQPLTRAQAITIVVKALGLEGMAPTPGYTTQYRDDHQIPSWARDSIYVASQLGLVAGYDGYVFPNEVMSKAETAVFLSQLITYLQRDLREDYRERIIYYR